MNGLSLSFDQVTFGFAEANPVLCDLSFQIPAGGICSVVGRSGIGKSTILNLAAGYLMPSRGTIRAGGAEIRGPGKERVPIFQEDGLLPWRTCMGNVLLGSSLNGGKDWKNEMEQERGRRILERVGLSRLDHGKFPKNMSVGMKKRTEIARAVLLKPAVLLADEPFSSLDTVTRLELHTLMLELWSELDFTILLISHDLEETILLAQTIVVLAPTSPASVTEVIENPFQGQFDAPIRTPTAVQRLRERITNGMRGGLA